MKELNKYIIPAIKYLENPESVSVDDMTNNYKEAIDYAAFVAVADYAVADYATLVAAAYAAAYAAYAALVAADYDADYDAVNKRLDTYFEISGENKQDYIDHINTMKGE